MRNILLFSLLLLTHFCRGQRTLTGPQLYEKNNRHVSCLLQKNQERRHKTVSAKATTATAERLIASANYFNYDTVHFSIIDTTHYSYSSDRSSVFNFNLMGFDDFYLINAGFLMGFYPRWGKPNHNNQPYILCDTSVAWSPDTATSTTLIKRDTRYFLYDTFSNVIENADLYNMDSSMSYPESKYVNTFTSNNLTKSIALSWNMGVWDTSALRYLSYDTSNNVILDSTELYFSGTTLPFENWKYTYDGYNNLVKARYYINDFSTSTWSLQQEFDMTYNTDNSLKTDSVSSYESSLSMMIPNVKDSFFYTSGVPFATTLKEMRYSYGTLTEWNVTTKHLSSSLLPDTMYSSRYGAGIGLGERWKKYYLYDSYNEPVFSATYAYNITDTATGAGSYDTTRSGLSYYYYETYMRHANGVNNTPAATASKINIFPNPANGTLYISQPGIAPGTRTGIQVINAAGQLLYTESLPWQHETEQMSLAGLAPGTYWILIQNAGGIVNRRQFVKL
ncbi:MAG: T9SS type A sorting domain-containing protein [Taibaiella sp.]|nr:T9SS type A sorting domain-containing protein [Taibaiella sp.]